jgi:hypothetical protein
MFKRCRMVLLSTNKKSKIWLNDTLSSYSHEQRLGSPGNPQHLYILSDEEIKVGDWYYTSLEHDNPFIRQCKVIDKSKEYWLDNNLKYQMALKFNYGSYKIIASTDSSLSYIRNFKSGANVLINLPSPSQALIEKYVSEYNKGNKIIDVVVEYEAIPNEFDNPMTNPKGKDNFCGHEEELKVNLEDNSITIKEIKDSWSKDEVIALFNRYNEFIAHHDIEKWNKWIEENI